MRGIRWLRIFRRPLLGQKRIRRSPEQEGILSAYWTLAPNRAEVPHPARSAKCCRAHFCGQSEIGRSLARGELPMRVPFAPPSDFENGNKCAPKNMLADEQLKPVDRNAHSQQVWRKPPDRERISAPPCGLQSTAQRLQPSKTTRNFGRPGEWRTGCVRELADQSDLPSNLLWARKPLKLLKSAFSVPFWAVGATSDNHRASSASQRLASA